MCRTVRAFPPTSLQSMFPGSGRSLLRRMAIQFCAVVLLVVAHGFVIAYTDPIYTSAPLTQVIVYRWACVRACCHRLLASHKSTLHVCSVTAPVCSSWW